MTSTLAGILMQKYNHCDDENYYENWTNWMVKAR
jgi:hypothetical protein